MLPVLWIYEADGPIDVDYITMTPEETDDLTCPTADEVYRACVGRNPGIAGGWFTVGIDADGRHETLGYTHGEGGVDVWSHTGYIPGGERDGLLSRQGDHGRLRGAV